MLDLEKLRVSFIVGTLGQGGAERQLFYILTALRLSGADTRLLCLTRGEYWEDRVRRMGVPVTWVGQSNSRLGRLAQIIAELRKQPADILHSQHFYTNLYASAAARALGLREIGAMRSNGISEVRGNGRVFGRLSLRAPRVIAANSRAAIKNAIVLGASAARLHLLPNVVDTDQFSPVVSRKREAVWLIAAGRLGEEKRLDRFLNLVARLQRLSPEPVRAMIVGDGPRRPQLQQQASELGLMGNAVEFKSAVSDMPALYREADILVLTSDWEGTPNVILEAMASGLPVVATGVGGVPEVVRHGETGFVVDPDDIDSLTDSVLRLICDSQLRMEMGCQARQYIMANHAPRHLPARLAKIYEVALS